MGRLSLRLIAGLGLMALWRHKAARPALAPGAPPRTPPRQAASEEHPSAEDDFDASPVEVEAAGAATSMVAVEPIGDGVAPGLQAGPCVAMAESADAGQTIAEPVETGCEPPEAIPVPFVETAEPAKPHAERAGPADGMPVGGDEGGDGPRSEVGKSTVEAPVSEVPRGYVAGLLRYAQYDQQSDGTWVGYVSGIVAPWSTGGSWEAAATQLTEVLTAWAGELARQGEPLPWYGQIMSSEEGRRELSLVEAARRPARQVENGA